MQLDEIYLFIFVGLFVCVVVEIFWDVRNKK
jgi:hypothetical protein